MPIICHQLLRNHWIEKGPLYIVRTSKVSPTSISFKEKDIGKLVGLLYYTNQGNRESS